MYLIVIAWIYVTLMMAVAEATSTTGTVLGAIITFVLYGLLPMGLVVYILGTPSRKRAIKAREQALQDAYDAEQNAAVEGVAGTAVEATVQPLPGAPGPLPGRTAEGADPAAASVSVAPDAGREAAAATGHGRIAPVRKEP